MSPQGSPTVALSFGSAATLARSSVSAETLAPMKAGSFKANWRPKYTLKPFSRPNSMSVAIRLCSGLSALNWISRPRSSERCSWLTGRARSRWVWS